MPADLGNAYVNIVPKAQGISKGIEDILGGGEAAAGAEKAGGALGGKLLGGLAKLGIGAAIGSTLKESFEAGGALQQSFGGLETIYGDAAAGAKAYAAEAAKAGISMNTYAEQAVSFGASLKQAYGGDTQAAMEAANLAILDMADNAAKMGTPLESIQNAYQGFAKQNYTMLDNLKLGYGGTKEEMERLLADAEAFSGVHYDISNLGDVYSAIHVIQEELGLAGVAAGEAETTFTGSFGAMKASWENVMAAMTTGENLEAAMDGFSSSVSNFAENVFSMLGTLADQLPDLILGLADVIIDNAPEFIKSGVEIIVKLAAGLLQALPDLIASIPDIVAAVFDAFGSVDWWELGWNIVMGIIDGITRAAGRLWDALTNLAMSSVQYPEAALGISSPSRVFADQVGRWIPAGMAEGIEDNLEPVRVSAQLMADAAVPSVEAYRPTATADRAPAGEELRQLLEALRNMKFDFYMDGRRITDSVTIRQQRNARSGVNA